MDVWTFDVKQLRPVNKKHLLAHWRFGLPHRCFHIGDTKVMAYSGFPHPEHKSQRAVGPPTQTQLFCRLADYFLIRFYSKIQISQKPHKQLYFRQDNKLKCHKSVTFENREHTAPGFRVNIQFCRSRSMILTFAICRYKSAGIVAAKRIRNG